MSGLESGGHFIGPFSVPESYESPEYCGFIGFVRNSINDPLPKEATILYKNSKGKWKTVKTKTRTKFGNISWRGPRKKENKEYPHWVITYHGPQGRSLPTSLFTYGTDAKHREVYMGGGLIGIAPGPVLGACLREIKKVRYLVVICLASGVEKVLRRRLMHPVFSKDEKRLEALARFEDPGKKDVVGWKELGQITVGDGYLGPETPWFFNESGTEAQCMRRKEKTGVFNDVEVEELASDRFKLTLDALYVAPMGNQPAIEAYSACSVPAAGGFSLLFERDAHFWHLWRTYILDAGSWGYGEQVVAVDYKEDEEVFARVAVANGQYAWREYMEGCDIEFDNDFGMQNSYPPTSPHRYYNPHCMSFPDETWPPQAFEAGTRYPAGQVNIAYPHTIYPYTARAVAADKRLTGTRLLCGSMDVDEGVVLERTKRISEREIQSGDPDNLPMYLRKNSEIVALAGATDPRRLAKVEYEESFVKHLDLRDRSGISLLTRTKSTDEYNIEPTRSVQTDKTSEELCGWLEEEKEIPLVEDTGPEPSKGKQTTFNEEEETYNPHIDILYEGLLPHSQFRLVIGDPENNTGGWSRGDVDWFATTWTGRRPKDNDNAEIGDLPSAWFIPNRQARWRDGWYGTLTVHHDKFYPNYPQYGGCGGDYVTSGVSLGDTFGDFTGGTILKSSIPDIGTLLGGKLFYPFSEL